MRGVLYDVNVRTANEHLKHIFADNELEEVSVIRNFRITATDGKKYITKAELSEKELLLCAFAIEVTKHPKKEVGSIIIDQLKKLGVSDEAILDLTLFTAYFNFVNRIVLSLNVSFSEEEIQADKHKILNKVAIFEIRKYQLIG